MIPNIETWFVRTRRSWGRIEYYGAQYGWQPTTATADWLSNSKARLRSDEWYTVLGKCAECETVFGEYHPAR